MIDAIEFYNLTRKEGRQQMLKQEELELLMGHLERHSYHPHCREEYIIKDERYVD